MVDINNEHFDKLVECCQGILALPSSERKSAWIGKSTAAWVRSVTKSQHSAFLGVDPTTFSEAPFDRQELSGKITRSRENLSDQNLREIVIDILAWGVMSVRNARLALPKWNDWKAPCIALLQGCDAVDAYNKFYRLQHSKVLSGIGPAYYTKIIYFLGKGDGLIMDQWTSRSVNLIFGKELIDLQAGQQKATKTDRTYTVKQTNGPEIYAAYNEAVEIIAKNLSERLSQKISPSDAEEFLFSFTTDRKKSPHLSDDHYYVETAWRKYVEETHRP